MSAAFPERVIEEARRPKGDGALSAPRRTAHADNPLCGDEIDLDVDDDGTLVLAVAHRTRGCSFAKASASLLAQAVPGMAIERALELCATLRADLAGTADLPPALDALSSVRMYPARVKCALIPWDALRSALDLSA